MMDSEIVFLGRINDWMPSEDEKKILERLKDNETLVKEEVCVSYEVWDQSITYWITCKKSWLEDKSPTLSTREPEHLEYNPENYGYHFITKN